MSNLFDDIQLSGLLDWEGQGTERNSGSVLFDDVHAMAELAPSEPISAQGTPAETAAPEREVSSQAPNPSSRLDAAPLQMQPGHSYPAGGKRQGQDPKRRKGAHSFRRKIPLQVRPKVRPRGGGNAALRLQACGQPIKAGSCTTPITVICCLSTPCFREPMPLSYLMPFDFAEDRSNPAEIEAHVLMRGGHFVTWGTRVALAVLEGKPAVLLLDGPAAGRYMWLSRSGIGHRCSIWDPIFQDLTDEIVPPAPDTKQSGQVFDLAGGEARLRNVMQLILEDIGPQVSAQITREALEQQSFCLQEGAAPASLKPIWWNETDCLDAFAPLLEAGPVGSMTPASAGMVDVLRRHLSDGLRDLFEDRRSSAQLVLATPGLGKTRSVQALIERLPKEAVVWVFQPTLRKAYEFAQDMAGSSRPIRVFRGRGAHVTDGASDRMCQRHTAAAEVAANGLSIKKMLCGITDQSTQGTCPHVTTCAYQRQIKDLREHQGGGVFVMTHASLTQLPSCPAPHLVIVDEDPSAVLPQTITVAAQAMGAGSSWAAHLHEDDGGLSLRPARSAVEANDGDLHLKDEAEEPDAVIATFERLLDALASAGPLREIATSIAMTELEAARKVLRGLERKLRTALKPAGKDNALRELLSVPDVPELLALQAVLDGIIQEVRLFSSGLIDRPDFNGLTITRKEDGRVRSVAVHRLARMALKPSVPMIILDGTADPVLLGRALRRRIDVWRIDVQRQGEVVHCLGRGFSNTSLVPTTGYSARSSAAAERDQLWQGLATALRREVAAAPKGVLVVSTLAVETEARRRECCDDLLGEALDWTHFGATRGINAYTNRQTIVVIGRKQPPAMAVQTLAQSYFALDPRPFDPATSDYVVRRRTVHDKAGRVSSTAVQVHPDPRVNRVLWQMREAEVLQAVDRVRAVRFPRRIVILNALDLRRPDEGLFDTGLGLPPDQYLSWPELRNGGNRAEAVLTVSGGFLPVAPKALTQIAPEVFPSTDAAKKWLHRTDLAAVLDRHSQHLIRLQVRPAGQRGAPWPLIIDRRQHDCPAAARCAFEALMGADMAVWASGSVRN